MFALYSTLANLYIWKLKGYIMKGAAPTSHITGVPGWETTQEQEYLFALASKLPENAVILEIGGEFGMSASIFSKAAPTARIYSIDNRYGGEVGEIHSANLQDAGLGQNVQRINADSHDKATLTKFKKQEKTVDLLFVDGDHSVQGALLDLQMYSPLVKVGGMLILHDTASQTNKLPIYKPPLSSYSV
jgi:predicted O-methyltransferase YrrM